jgi:septum formation protein
MVDTKNAETPTEPPPSYETAAQQPPAQSGPRLRAPLPLDLPALRALRGRRVVLASASPRRKQLLAQIGLGQVDVVPSTFAEDLSKTLSPFEYVLQTASQKAMQVYEQEIDNEEKGEPALIIGKDFSQISIPILISDNHSCRHNRSVPCW